MSTLLPDGYLSFREAAVILQNGMFSGVPDRKELLDLRQKHGMAISDGSARQEAIRELWSAVDKQKLRLMAIGGIPRRIIRLDPQLTEEVPFLRHPRVGSFHYVRSSHPMHSKFRAWFGRELAQVELAVRKSEVDRLVKSARRSRRAKRGPSKSGRPSLQTEVRAAIQTIADAQQWTSLQSVKALTSLVNRRISRTLSEDTVARALDGLFAATRDRKYARVQRNRASTERNAASPKPHRDHEANEAESQHATIFLRDPPDEPAEFIGGQ
jgi:hypothetical protein